MTDSRATIRVDKWLWYARFFKTRGLASKQVTAGHVRINSAKISKAAHQVGAGDTLTFPQGTIIRVVEILELGVRRGPAPEAEKLFHDRTPVQEKRPPAIKTARKGRPTKKDRRGMLLSRDAPLE